MINAILGRHRACRGEKHFVARLDRIDIRTLHAFDQHLDRAIGQLQHLQNICHATDTVQIFGFRLILDGRLLGDQQDSLASLHGHFKRFD